MTRTTYLKDSELVINIDEVQARKNLSVLGSGKVPQVWNEARARGRESIDALVLIAIAFSHHKLISALKVGAGKKTYCGSIIRGKQLDEKEFTNFAHVLEELGYGTKHTAERVDYDFRRLFSIAGFGQLAYELLKLKLGDAGLDGSKDIVDELVDNDFHRALAITEAEFRAWLSAAPLTPGDQPIEDPDFFLADDDEGPYAPFRFKPGHNPKRTGTVPVAAGSAERTATLLHNEMQTLLVAQLEKKYGRDHVGAEVPTGHGTSIDIVVETPEFRWFYEIKTAPSVRACVRQALPQLLEYAYWDGAVDRCDRLIVVGPKPVTRATERYLEFLRRTFRIEVYYEDCRLS